MTHHGIEGLRLVVAALDMLQGEGMTLQQALDHVSLASRQGGDAQARTSVVIITRQPWDAETVQAYTEAAHARATGLLYLPAYQETGLEGLRLGTLTLDDYIATMPTVHSADDKRQSLLLPVHAGARTSKSVAVQRDSGVRLPVVGHVLLRRRDGPHWKWSPWCLFRCWGRASC